MHHLCARLLPTLQCPMHAVASHAVGALTTARLKGCSEHTSHMLEGCWALRGLLWSPPWASCSLLMDSLSHLSPCGSCSWLTSPLSGSLKRLYLPSVSHSALDSPFRTRTGSAPSSCCLARPWEACLASDAPQLSWRKGGRPKQKWL